MISFANDQGPVISFHPNDYIKGDKYFLFIKVGAANALMKLNYL